MLRCVWPALNLLSIHVTFTAIVPGAYPGEAKMCLRLIAETDARSVGDSHSSCMPSLQISLLISALEQTCCRFTLDFYSERVLFLSVNVLPSDVVFHCPILQFRLSLHQCLVVHFSRSYALPFVAWWRNRSTYYTASLRLPMHHRIINADDGLT